MEKEPSNLSRLEQELDRINRSVAKFIAIMLCIAFVAGWATIWLYIATRHGLV